ncbi:MAG: response regulator [bacterium]
MAKKVLIVDDTPSIRTILRANLNAKGYKTAEACDGVEALEILEKQKFDIMLLDIQMPRMSGTEVCAKLKLKRRYNDMGIIIITATGEQDDIVEIFRVGADAWIAKPFTFSVVFEKIEATIKHREEIQKFEVCTDWVNFNFASEEHLFDEANHFLSLLLAKSRFSEKDFSKLRFAISEILRNALEHGNKFEKDKWVSISYVIFQNKFVLKIKDEGTGFNLVQVPDVIKDPFGEQARREAAGIRPGGFGLAMVKEIMDDISYSDKGNEVLMTKYLN